MQAIAFPRALETVPRALSPFPQGRGEGWGSGQLRVSSLGFCWPRGAATPRTARAGDGVATPSDLPALCAVTRRILLNYAVYDPATGYSQGMSDLVAPILAEVLDESDTFWCFVGLMQNTIFVSSPRDEDMEKQLVRRGRGRGRVPRDRSWRLHVAWLLWAPGSRRAGVRVADGDGACPWASGEGPALPGGTHAALPTPYSLQIQRPGCAGPSLVAAHLL